MKERYALLSVSDKDGIVEFGNALQELGFKILSTGGTLKTLKDNNVKATEVSEFTSSPELFDGRIKTLHPKIHGGILYRRDNPKDCTNAMEFGIKNIELVCVNLYPFKETIERSNDFDEIIENIDIGGPAMVRAAAKNFNSVLIVTSKLDYAHVLKALRCNQNTLELRKELMIKAFEHTASYDAMIANYFNKRFNSGFGEKQFIVGEKFIETRYGENPHQSGALYQINGEFSKYFRILKGEPSFNNITDVNAAIKLATNFKEAKAVAIVKHGNACGFGMKDNLLSSYVGALVCDKLSAYGGVCAINGIVDEELALKINEIFIEVLVCADITESALKIFESKKRMKIFTFSKDKKYLCLLNDSYDFKHIEGGFVYQSSDKVSEDEIKNAKIVSKKIPSTRDLADLAIAYKIAALTKSNCVTYVKNGVLLAIGMGMTSRVDAGRAAWAKAKDMGVDLSGACMASEAFFPFKDSIELASKMGVGAIIQPGGSIRDDEVIAESDAHNISLLFSGVRHFLH